MAFDSKNAVAQIVSEIGADFSLGIQALGGDEISKWLIRPGMEFASPNIWWGDTSKTRADAYGGGPHEGLDFAIAETSTSGQIKADMANLPVHALLDGKTIWKFDDLVGDTLIVASNSSFQDFQFIIQYSHIVCTNAPLGSPLARGNLIGKIKRSENPKSSTASHLHTSTAFLEKKLLELPAESVSFKNWLEWQETGKLIYIDPLSLLSEEAKAQRFAVGDAAKSPLHSIITTGVEKEERLSLRRSLSLNFPGIQILGAKKKEDAECRISHKSLLVSTESSRWEIAPSEDLLIPQKINLSGQNPSELLESISLIEHANRANAINPC